MDNTYLKELIDEAKKRGGGLVLNLEERPELVVLTIEKYNQLLKISNELNSQSAEELKKEKILITGGAGYIGSHIAKQLLENGHEVVVLDNLSVGKKENVPQGAIFYEGDIRDLNLLRDIFGQRKIDVVMHMAAAIEVEESVKNPGKYFENNVLGTATLLEAMDEAGIKKIVFSSTAAVYEGQSQLISENSKVNPLNPYGQSKLIGESLIKYYCDYSSFSAVVLRYFNACGSGFEGTIKPTHDSHLIAKIMKVAKGAQDSLIVNGDDYQTPDGSCIRDYIHVLDIAAAHILALKAFKENSLEIFNVGTGKGLSVLEIINGTAEILNKMIPMELGPRRIGDLPQTVADNTKIKTELGFFPKHSDLETIIRTSWKSESENAVLDKETETV